MKIAMVVFFGLVLNTGVAQSKFDHTFELKGKAIGNGKGVEILVEDLDDLLLVINASEKMSWKMGFVFSDSLDSKFRKIYEFKGNGNKKTYQQAFQKAMKSLQEDCIKNGYKKVKSTTSFGQRSGNTASYDPRFYCIRD